LTLKPSKFKFLGGAGLGAAFLMANSSIGPGFLTQTTVFNQQLLTSFGFVILVSVLLDIGAQLNTWRILTVSELRAQDISNQLLPGLGYFLSVLVVIGGFAFNIGNIAGCALGVNVLTGISFSTGAKAIHHSFIPEKISIVAIVTIVGGTVGGYLTFSGAHRLLDAGIKGKENLARVNKSAMSGIIISTIMRIILFLAVVGVLTQGAVLDNDNPPASVFHFAAGEIGLRIFGIVLWSAAISSVVGA